MIIIIISNDYIQFTYYVQVTWHFITISFCLLDQDINKYKKNTPYSKQSDTHMMAIRWIISMQFASARTSFHESRKLVKWNRGSLVASYHSCTCNESRKNTQDQRKSEWAYRRWANIYIHSAVAINSGGKGLCLSGLTALARGELAKHRIHLYFRSIGFIFRRERCSPPPPPLSSSFINATAESGLIESLLLFLLSGYLREVRLRNYWEAVIGG